MTEELERVVFDVDGFMVETKSDPPYPVVAAMYFMQWVSTHFEIIPITWTLSDRERLQSAMNSLSQSGYSSVVTWLENGEMYHSDNQPVKPKGYKSPRKVGARILIDDDDWLREPVEKEGGIYIDPTFQSGETDMEWGERMRREFSQAMERVSSLV